MSVSMGMTLRFRTGGERTVGQLTARERAVVDIVLKGCSNREIAARLGISEQTVKNHLTSAFVKLQVRSRMQLLLRIVERKSR